jgi:alpha-tubulin suppressor-like RCC1 family protein
VAIVNGDLAYQLAPVAIVGATDVKAVIVGGLHACALLTNGTVSCWGHNDLELGVSSNMAVFPDATALPGARSVTSVVAGNADFTCFSLQDGTATCLGNNADGELGNGGATGQGAASTTPVLVSGLTNVTSVAAQNDGPGPGRACAVLADGTVWCWGTTTLGSLGDGTTATSSVPIQAVGVTNAVNVVVGDWDTFAVLANGRIMGWGHVSATPKDTGIN